MSATSFVQLGDGGGVFRFIREERLAAGSHSRRRHRPGGLATALGVVGDHDGHRALPIEPRRLKFVAGCECGWRSEVLSTAGMANAAFDRHLSEVAGRPES